MLEMRGDRLELTDVDYRAGIYLDQLFPEPSQILSILIFFKFVDLPDYEGPLLCSPRIFLVINNIFLSRGNKYICDQGEV